jgi:hypothetical protein
MFEDVLLLLCIVVARSLTSFPAAAENGFLQ